MRVVKKQKNFIIGISSFLFFFGLIILCTNCTRCRRKKIIIEPDTTDTIVFQDLEVPFTDGVPHQFIRRDEYSTSYNHETRCPNWVAWVLTKERAQSEKIETCIWYDDNNIAFGINNFSKDIVRGKYIFDAEADEPRPELFDWSERPKDMTHGHLCPAADCYISKSAMNQSLLLTNLCVQAEKLNNGSWRKLEDKCRKLAKKGITLFIVAGPIFDNGNVSKRMGNIAIPDAFFKVLLCMEGTPKTIGFYYTNTNDKHNMQDAVRTVDQIEELTGFDFFPQLPDSIENIIECKANLNDWQ